MLNKYPWETLYQLTYGLEKINIVWSNIVLRQVYYSSHQGSFSVMVGRYLNNNTLKINEMKICFHSWKNSGMFIFQYDFFLLIWEEQNG